jgi:putative transcriptional regulator
MTLVGVLAALFPGLGLAQVTLEASRSFDDPSRPRVVQEPPAPGKFLVASTDLLDPNFVETVVLLVDYSSEGALGVIVNRPTDTLVSEALPELGELSESSGRIWLGGPVAQWQLVMLARSETELAQARPVMGDLYFSASRSALESVVTEQGEYRLYAGYAGWSAGQLDQEIERGGWRVMAAEIAMVFDPAPLDLWDELIRRSTVHWAQLPTRGRWPRESQQFSRTRPQRVDPQVSR